MDVNEAFREWRDERDAMIEEAVDEQTRSIKAALMDALHDHALTLNDSLAGIVRRLEAERDALRYGLSGAQADKLQAQRDREKAEVERDALRAGIDRDGCVVTLEAHTAEIARAERAEAALRVGITAVVNLCTHLYLSPHEWQWHTAVREDLQRMRVALRDPASREEKP